MKLFQLYNKITVCSFFFLIKLSTQQDFTIFRTVNSSNNEYPWSSRDKFNMSEAKCRESLERNDNPCLEYAGSFTRGEMCFCTCPWVLPTFIYQGNSSKCKTEQETRNSKGKFIFPLIIQL